MRPGVAGNVAITSLGNVLPRPVGVCFCIPSAKRSAFKLPILVKHGGCTFAVGVKSIQAYLSLANAGVAWQQATPNDARV